MIPFLTSGGPKGTRLTLCDNLKGPTSSSRLFRPTTPLTRNTTRSGVVGLTLLPWSSGKSRYIRILVQHWTLEARGRRLQRGGRPLWRPKKDDVQYSTNNQKKGRTEQNCAPSPIIRRTVWIHFVVPVSGERLRRPRRPRLSLFDLDPHTNQSSTGETRPETTEDV